MSIHIDIIVISYNSFRFLPEFFHFIKNKTHLPFHLIVFDNNSADESRTYLKQLTQVDSIRDRIRLVLNSKNIGVAKAWNQGIKMCDGEFIVFLNPDIKLTDLWLEKMVHYAQNYPNAGVLGAKILNYDGTIFHAGLLNGVRGNGKKDRPDLFDSVDEVHGIQGSCFMVRRSVLPTTGLFDEQFFVYGEEDDFCKRVRKAGYSVLYTPIPIYHKREGSSIPSNERARLRTESQKKFSAKWRAKGV